MLAFADLSKALWPLSQGGMEARLVNYAKVDLSTNGNARKSLGRRLAAIGSLVEERFGSPQDIEGGVVKGEIFLVQSRPLQMPEDRKQKTESRSRMT